MVLFEFSIEDKLQEEGHTPPPPGGATISDDLRSRGPPVKTPPANVVVIGNTPKNARGALVPDDEEEREDAPFAAAASELSYGGLNGEDGGGIPSESVAAGALVDAAKEGGDVLEARAGVAVVAAGVPLDNDTAKPPTEAALVDGASKTSDRTPVASGGGGTASSQTEPRTAKSTVVSPEKEKDEGARHSAMDAMSANPSARNLASELDVLASDQARDREVATTAKEEAAEEIAKLKDALAKLTLRVNSQGREAEEIASLNQQIDSLRRRQNAQGSELRAVRAKANANSKKADSLASEIDGVRNDTAAAKERADDAMGVASEAAALSNALAEKVEEIRIVNDEIARLAERFASLEVEVHEQTQVAKNISVGAGMKAVGLKRDMEALQAKLARLDEEKAELEERIDGARDDAATAKKRADATGEEVERLKGDVGDIIDDIEVLDEKQKALSREQNVQGSELLNLEAQNNATSKTANAAYHMASANQKKIAQVQNDVNELKAFKDELENVAKTIGEVESSAEALRRLVEGAAANFLSGDDGKLGALGGAQAKALAHQLNSGNITIRKPRKTPFAPSDVIRAYDGLPNRSLKRGEFSPTEAILAKSFSSCGLKAREIAKKLDRKEDDVAKYLRKLELPLSLRNTAASLREMIDRGELDATILAKLPDEMASAVREWPLLSLAASSAQPTMQPFGHIIWPGGSGADRLVPLAQPGFGYPAMHGAFDVNRLRQHYAMHPATQQQMGLPRGPHGRSVSALPQRRGAGNKALKQPGHRNKK